MGFFPQHPFLSNRVFTNANRLVERPENYHVELDAVGILSDDIEIHATENELLVTSPKPELAEGLTMIHKERINSGLRQRFRFRNAIDVDAISADLTNGLLILTVPKKEPRRVHVSVGLTSSEQLPNL